MNNEAKTDKWLTSEQARKRLNMSKTTFFRRVKSGHIPARKDGPRTYRFRESDIEFYIKNHMTFPSLKGV